MIQTLSQVLALEAYMSELWRDAFLLHQRPYGNTSVMAEMFTLDNGRISVIAKGAKKPKSKFFGVLSPFSKLRITYRGKSELKTLTNVDKEDIFSDSFSKLSYTLLYINELLIKILPQGAPQKELFNLYDKFLLEIKTSNEIDIILRRFEIDLLEMLGYGINFINEVDSGQSIDADKLYDFVPELGFKESPNGIFNGKEIISISKLDFENINKKKFKSLTTMAIGYSLDGGDLKSRQIFKTLKK
tara:strand:+ start:1156 stop:1887 length:732 start_codon:yes stop_codon:yes gene_type:complete